MTPAERRGSSPWRALSAGARAGCVTSGELRCISAWSRFRRMAVRPEVVEGLREHRVRVVGDLMIDEYLRGDVHRVSPEAPVPVLDLKSTEHRLGGAANTAANMARLGAKATVIGVVGEDDGARILAGALA